MTGTSVDTGRAARIVLIALIFFAAALNYVDRQVLALLKPTLEAEFTWTNTEFAMLGTAFQFATAFALLFVGWFVDRFGVRFAYAFAVVAWSLAGMGHALASTVQQFVAARIALAAAEAINTPAAMKSAAMYLPDNERSIGIGIINTAPNIGAMLTPLLIPPLALAFGWKAAFVVTGALGFVWVVFWILGTRNLAVQPRAASAAQIKVNWPELFADPRSWVIIGAKFLTDFVWAFVLFWTPDYFAKHFHMTQGSLGGPVAIVFSLAALGAITSGGIYPILRSRGMTYNGARKSSMLFYACIAMVFPLALVVSNPWVSAVIIGIGLFAHQGFSTNVFGIATDIVPTQRVGSVVAMGAVAANLSGMAIIAFTGWALDAGSGYAPMFLMCGAAYLCSLGFVQLVQPVLKPWTSPEAP